MILTKELENQNKAQSEIFIFLGITLILSLIICPTSAFSGAGRLFPVDPNQITRDNPSNDSVSTTALIPPTSFQSTVTNIKNLAASDVSTPITVKLTQSKIPLVNEETTLRVEVSSIFDAPGTNIKIILPPEVELISGLLETNIDLQANMPESFETIIKFSQPGNFKITALAHKEIDQDNSWGDMSVLYLTIGEVGSKISTAGSITYAQRAQSESEQRLNNSEISTLPQYLNSESPQMVMPNELPIDSNEKSAEPNFIYSPQNSPNNTIQAGTLTVKGQWTYYTKVIGGEIADYRDTDDTRVRLKHAYVAIYDSTLLFLLGSGYTDDYGNFSINIVNQYPSSFYVSVYSYNKYTDPGGINRELRVVSQGTTLSGLTDVWRVYAGPFASTDGSHIQNIGSWYPLVGGDYEHAFMLFQDLIRARDFIGWDVGSSTILWYPTSNDGTYYHQGGQIYLLGEDYKSADISIHEFGHNYMWTKKGNWANTCPSPHYINAGNNTQCAYKEGWADFLPLAVNGNPYITWASGSSLNLETPTWGTPYWDNGDGCEGRVAGALWDMYDNINDGYDEYQFPYSFNDATMRQNTGWTFSDFWNTWKSFGYSSDAGWAIYQNTIDYFPPPSVRSISPISGLNSNSVVQTTLTGNYFLTGAVVGLTKNNQTGIIATNTIVNSPQKITCDFNLTGAEAGQYDVVVMNPSSQYGMLNKGFTILSPPLVPNFFATPTDGIAPLVVQFTDNSTGSPTSWDWSFGDGNISIEKNPVHTYPFSGTFTVSLNVTNANGYNTTTRTGYITVNYPALVSRPGLNTAIENIPGLYTNAEHIHLFNGTWSDNATRDNQYSANWDGLAVGEKYTLFVGKAGYLNVSSDMTVTGGNPQWVNVTLAQLGQLYRPVMVFSENGTVISTIASFYQAPTGEWVNTPANKHKETLTYDLTIAGNDAIGVAVEVPSWLTVDVTANGNQAITVLIEGSNAPYQFVNGIFTVDDSGFFTKTNATVQVSAPAGSDGKIIHIQFDGTVKGDGTGDGSVTAADALMATRTALRLTNIPTTHGYPDVSLPFGRFTAADTLSITRNALGLLDY